nr:hypothetical protein BaRGS_010749 [Batillaria attramentaria]
MAYPDWTDCTRFIYCYGGTVTTYSCNTVMGDLSTMWYFNPTDKICERVQKPSNSCLFRSFDLRTVTM